jgi:tetratricopeptide (TPR) repeat protein
MRVTIGVLIPFILLVNCADPLVGKGNKNLLLGDYPRAIILFSKAVDRDPNSFDARLGLGKAILQQLSVVVNVSDEQWSACLTNLEAARTLNSSVSVDKILSVAWNQRAVALLNNSDTSSALAALMKSIQYDKKNAKPLNLAGVLYFYKGEQDKAISLFSLVTQLDSLSPSGAFNSGIVSWSKGDCINARSIWRQALVRFPDDKELLYWTALAEKTCGAKE